MYSILIAEDDKVLNDTLTYNLSAEGYQVTAVFNATDAVDAAHKNNFDLIILDVNLPDFLGYEVCEKIKKAKNTPIVFLTVRDMEADILKGYAAGGDDYVTKPFSMTVLQRKVNAILSRWSRKAQGEVYDDGRLRIDFSSMQASKDGIPIELTSMDYRLLKLLTANPGTVLTRSSIIDKLWDQEENYADEHALTAAISRIRSKIEHVDESRYIKTIYGMGYMWTGEQNENH